VKPSQATHPRLVPPGIESHLAEVEKYARAPDPGVYCGLDWIRMTHHEHKLDETREFLNRWFGRKSKQTRGAIFFSGGEEWEPGVQLSYGHNAGVIMVDIRGARLRTMDADDALKLLFEIARIGFKPTRLDGAIDYVDQNVNLVEQALASCERGELTGLRSFEVSMGHTIAGVPEKRMLRIGKRDSALCARLYDKSLEQKCGPAGQWERLEVEFKDERAVELLRALQDAGSDWVDVLASRTLGAFDFRENTGRREIARRPRVAWWADLVDRCDPEKPQLQRQKPIFARWAIGFRTSYLARARQLAEEVGVPLGVMVEWLAEGVPADDRDDQLLQQFREIYAETMHAVV